MDEKEFEYEYIRVEQSDIFFYCEVSRDSVLELCTAVKRLEHERYMDITIHIHSEGGDLHAGLGAMDFLRSAKSNINTVVEGLCASAATFVFLGGDTRTVLPNAYILIHQISHELWGKYEELKDEMIKCEKLMKRIKRIYLHETTIPEEKLNLLLQRDLYLSRRKCVKYGIV
jgi:ATP-dependent protease ClpP protease subunit